MTSNVQDKRSVLAYERIPDDQLGETLLSKQKRVNLMNKQKLRQAKNIEDLCQIDIATVVDGSQGKMFHNPQLDHLVKEQTELDLKYDPINYRQRAPMLGEKDFL